MILTATSFPTRTARAPGSTAAAKNGAWTTCLPPLGYLVRGPGGFLEYHAIRNGAIADVVRSDEYDYFSCAEQTDFGPVITDGIWRSCVREPTASSSMKIFKPRGIVLKLGELPGTDRSQRALKAWAVLTGDRRVELTFPDLRQPTNPADRSQPGSQVQLRPVEMRNTLKYEILLTPPQR